MELLLEPSNWALLAIIGLIAGFIDAIVGGGGLLSIPALLTLGIAPHTALGTNKLAASFGSSMAAWTYYRQHLFTPSFWYMAFIATFIGAVLGSVLVYLIDTQWLEKILPLLIIGIAIYSLLSKCHFRYRLPSPNTVATNTKTRLTRSDSRGLRWFCGPWDWRILDCEFRFTL